MGLSIGSIAEKAISTVADEVGGDFKGEVAKASGGETSKGGGLNFEGPPPPIVVAKDWGTTEAMYCNRTDENMYVFKDTYDKNGKPTGINGTAIPPGACGTGDFLLTDLNGDERLNLGGQNREFIKQPNAILGGFWNVMEGADGKNHLQAGNNAAIEELMIGAAIHGRGLYEPKTLGEMNRIMGGDKPVSIEGVPASQLTEAPITPRK